MTERIPESFWVEEKPCEYISQEDKIRLLEAEIDKLESDKAKLEERNKQLKDAIRKALLNILMLEVRLDLKTL